MKKYESGTLSRLSFAQSERPYRWVKRQIAFVGRNVVSATGHGVGRFKASAEGEHLLSDLLRIGFSPTVSFDAGRIKTQC
jgi:hypothetical protein